MAGLVVLGVLLALLDTTVLKSAFPHGVFGPPRPRPEGFRPPNLPGAIFVRRDGATARFPDFGPVGGLFTFWWFVASVTGLLLVSLAWLAFFPARARLAVERLESPGGIGLALGAGAVSLLLLAAASVLLRVTFLLLFLVPFAWAIVLVAAALGLAWVGLWVGRRLRSRAGPAHPLLAGLAGALVIYDIALVPIVGWIVFLALAVTGLGLVVITRFGSSWGWSLEELNW